MSKKMSCFTVNKLMSAVSGHVRSSSANAAGVGNPSPSPKRRAKPPNRREQARRLQEQRRQQQGEEEAGEWDWELAVAGNYGSPSKKSHVSFESSQYIYGTAADLGGDKRDGGGGGGSEGGEFCLSRAPPAAPVLIARLN